MISSVEISRFRGILEGKLEDLSPLTVLVGPNGCGKSSVLDALLIGASAEGEKSVVEVVDRHKGVNAGARWLFWRVGAMSDARVIVSTGEHCQRNTTLQLRGDMEIRCSVTLRSGTGCYRDIRFVDGGDALVTGKNDAFGALEGVPEIRLVDPFAADSQTTLDELFSRTIEQGRLKEVLGIVQQVIPDVQDLRILTEAGSPILHLVFADHSVPAVLAGDGIRSLVRTCLELACRPHGTVLIEEPEVHQHPAAIGSTVRAILAAVRRDIQVILTTHSLELIDYLMAESSDEDIEKLSLYRLELEGGRLISVRSSGSEVAFSRCEVEKDLR